MKRWKRYLMVFTVLVLMVLGTQAVMAADSGTTKEGFQWKYENGIMKITKYVGTDAVVSIPSTINGKKVTIIFNDAFGENDNVTKVTIPDTVTSIEGCAFMYCSKLASVNIPSSVVSIDNYAFQGCAFTNITIPNSVKTLGAQTFQFCVKLKSITIPDSVTVLERKVFDTCKNLKSATIPPSVTDIADDAFEGCKGLTIKGYYGSAAETYAKKNKIPFIGLGVVLKDPPASIKVKAKKNKVTLSWKKIKDKELLKEIKSIEVQYSTNKKFKNAKTKNVGKTKTKITLKLKKKKTYYIRVRYKGAEGYSEWSKVKKIKTKK